MSTDKSAPQISVTAQLDEYESKKIINKQLQRLEHSLKHINIDLNVNSKAAFRQLEKDAKKQGDKLAAIFTKEIKPCYNSFDISFNEEIQNVKELLNINEQVLNNINDSFAKYTLQLDTINKVSQNIPSNQGINSTDSSLPNIEKTLHRIIDLKSQFNFLSDIAKKLKNITKLGAGASKAISLLKAPGPFLMFTAAIEGISLIINKIKEAKTLKQELDQKFDNTVANFPQNYANLKDAPELIKRYKELVTLENKSREQYEELTNIRSHLTTLFPDLIDGYDKEGNAIFKSGKNLEEYLALKREQLDLEKNLILTTYDVKSEEKSNKIAQDKKELQELQEKYEQANKIYAKSKKKDLDPFNLGIHSATQATKDFQVQNLEEMSNEIILLQTNINKGSSDLAKLNTAALSASEPFANVDTNVFNTFNETLQQSFSPESIEKIITSGDALGILANQLNNVEKVTNQFSNKQIDATKFSEKFSASLDSAKEALKAFSSPAEINAWADSYKELTLSSFDVGTQREIINADFQNIKNTISDTTAKFNKLKDVLDKDLNSSLDESGSTASMTKDEYDGLLKKLALATDNEQDFSDAIEWANGKIIAHKGKINTIIDSYRKQAIELAKAQKSMTSDVAKEVMARAELYGIDINNIFTETDVITAYKNMYPQLEKKLGEILKVLPFSKSVKDGIINEYIKQTEGYGTLQTKSGFNERYQQYLKDLGKSSGSGSFKNKYISNPYENKINDFETQIKLSEAQMTSYDESSSQYRAELEKQIALREKEKNLTQAEINTLNTKLSILTEGTQEYDETKKKVQDLQVTTCDFQKSIDENRFSLVNLSLTEADSKIEKLTIRLERLKGEQNLYNEGSDEYNNCLSKQAKTIKEIIQALNGKQKCIQEELASSQLSIKQQADLKKVLEETSEETYEQSLALRQLVASHRQSLADSLVDSIKKGYSELQELEEQQLEKSLEDEEKRHDRKIELLDEELEKYKENIDGILQANERLNKKADYEQQLQEELQKRNELANELILAQGLSSSDSTRDVKIEKAQEALQAQDKKIAELTENRNRELTKEYLQDLKENKEREIQLSKDAEDEKLKNFQDKQDQQLIIIQDKYERLINNEQHFADLTSQIMQGTFLEAETEIGHILSQIEGYSGTTAGRINTSFQKLANTIKDLKKSLHDIREQQQLEEDSSVESTPEYYPYKGTINEIVWLKKQALQAQTSPEGIDDYGNTSQNIKSEAEKYYRLLPDDINNFLRQMDYNQASSWYNSWKHKAIKQGFHQGGIVGNAGSSSPLVKLTNKLFNLKPNEAVVKSLIGEVMVPPENILNNFLPNMQNFAQQLLPAVAMSPASSGDIDNHYDISININSLSGDKNGAKTMFKEFVNEIKKQGGKW